VIDYATTDFATDGSTYEVVVDCVGNAPVARVRGCLASGGSALLVAGDLGSLLSARRWARRLGTSVITGPGAYRAGDLAHVATLAAEGAFRPVIDRAVPFDAIADAHAYVDGGRKRGSVVVSIPS
jgi:NADPH:quinone reductase-like Zn-dependent oxidoreductase